MSETQTPQPNSTSTVDYATLLRRFHLLMSLVTGGGLLLVYLQFGVDHLLPFLLGSALVWVNMTILARGLGGVLNGEKSLAFLLLFKLAMLMGGVYLLSQLFPEQRTTLILGLSTWVIALFMVGQPKSNSAVNTLLILLSISIPTLGEAKPTEAELLEGEIFVHTVKIGESPMPKIIAEGIIKGADRCPCGQ